MIWVDSILTMVVSKMLQVEVALVDSAESCAEFLSERLRNTNLLNRGRRRSGILQPFVTDEVERFDELAKRFLGVPAEPAWKVDLPALSVSS